MSLKSFLFGCVVGSWVMYNKCRADIMKTALETIVKNQESEDKKEE